VIVPGARIRLIHHAVRLPDRRNGPDVRQHGEPRDLRRRLAVLASTLVAQSASCTNSALSVEKKLSATALSQQSPLRLMLHSMPAAASAAR
jgi:hypothetical protein